MTAVRVDGAGHAAASSSSSSARPTIGTRVMDQL
jgi:hypothetical protein